MTKTLLYKQTMWDVHKIGGDYVTGKIDDIISSFEGIETLSGYIILSKREREGWIRVDLLAEVGNFRHIRVSAPNSLPIHTHLCKDSIKKYGLLEIFYAKIKPKKS